MDVMAPEAGRATRTLWPARFVSALTRYSCLDLDTTRALHALQLGAWGAFLAGVVGAVLLLLLRRRAGPGAKDE